MYIKVCIQKLVFTLKHFLVIEGRHADSLEHHICCSIVL